MTTRGHVLLGTLYHDSSNEEVKELYNTWSKTYDADATEGFGYQMPSKGAEVFSEKMKDIGFSLDARILDLGAGTGMVGEALHKIGHRNVDALDFSAESLKIAKEKGVYRNLIQGSMASENSRDLGVMEKEYDAAICIGVFTLGHVKGKGFDDFIYAVKPGGLACFSVREDVADNPSYYYNEKMEELCREKKWKLLHKVHEIYCAKVNWNARLYIYQVLEVSEKTMQIH